MENDYRKSAALAIAGSAFATSGLLRGDLPGLLTAIAGGSLTIYSLLPERTRSEESAKPVFVQQTVTVPETPAEAYEGWRELKRLAGLFSGFQSIEELTGNRHAWTVRGKLGIPVKWETEIYNEQPGQLMEWRSVEGAPIRCSGMMRFKKKQGGRGTKVHVQMAYVPATGFSAEALNTAMRNKGL